MLQFNTKASTGGDPNLLLSDSTFEISNSSDSAPPPPSYIPLDPTQSLASEQSEVDVGPPPPSYIPLPPIDKLENKEEKVLEKKTDTELGGGGGGGGGEIPFLHCHYQEEERETEGRNVDFKEEKNRSSSLERSQKGSGKLKRSDTPSKAQMEKAENYNKSSPGPPPPCYIPAPPSKKRYSQPKPSTLLDSPDPPPPTYIPPLPNTNSMSVTNDGFKFLSMNNILKDTGENMDLDKSSKAFFGLFLTTELGVLVETVVLLIKTWLKPLVDFRPKAETETIEDNISEFKKLTFSKTLLKFLKTLQFSESFDFDEDYDKLTSPSYLSEIVQYSSTCAETIHHSIKTKMTSHYATYKNLEKSVQEEVYGSDNHSIYTNISPILSSSIEILQNIISDFNFAYPNDKRHNLITKDLTKSISHIALLHAEAETEELYFTNLTTVALHLSVSPKLKFELITPGRRFLQTAIFQNFTISSGKFKKGNQITVYLMNDVLLFIQGKAKEARRLSVGTKSPQQIFRSPGSPRTTPKMTKNKLQDFISLEVLEISEKIFGSENLIEFVAPGKRIIVAIDESKAEWLKLCKLQIAFCKSNRSAGSNATTTREKCFSPKPLGSPSPERRRERLEPVMNNGGVGKRVTAELVVSNEKPTSSTKKERTFLETSNNSNNNSTSNINSVNNTTVSKPFDLLVKKSEFY